MKMPRYDHKRIEPKWQAFWEKQKTFRTPDDIHAPDVQGKEKLYVLDMFPYPSGNGLHVGHPEGYTATDIVCRYSRMRGRNVLHPMGWDAFGLPAEQHAVKTGTHPRITTYKNIDTFRRQLKMLGFSYDWDREFSTTDPDYFRWTQWIFLQIFDTWYDPDCEWTDPHGQKRTGKGRPISELPIPEDVQAAGEEAVRRYQDKHRLAYQHEAPVNWCAELRTVLSNEEVNADGLSERGNHPVTRIPLRQWMLRITSYAERLIDDLEELDWSDSVKALQRNWIGRSEGAEVDFYIGSENSVGFDEWKSARAKTGFPAEPGDDVLRVYTTRPDTLYGATYMVLAPEHPFVDRITTDEHREAVEQYRKQASLKSDLDRTDLAKEKTGVFTGSYAVNPVNGEQIPIWIADYVLISYGTGAIMAVPAHDLRDWEFAVQFEIPIVPVVQPPDDYAPSKEEKALAIEGENGESKFPFAGQGTAINSGEFNGLSTEEFKTRITEMLAENGLGKKAVNYRLRDWLFSRQHFWGEPFPIWHELDADGKETGLLRTDPEDALPIELPENFEFKPHGRPEPPLEESPAAWLYKTAEDGTRLKRETNTMPQWAGSCWYYLRFCDNKNSERFIDPDKEKYWLPVDLYIGGAEHAVLHLLYSRFWHKVLFDRGYVTDMEPFQKLVNQGMILGEPELTAFKNEAGDWVSSAGIDMAQASAGQAIDPKTGSTLIPVKIEIDQVKKKGAQFVLKENPDIVVDSRAYKMSKSRGNVINPDDVVAQYGADALRMYEMFMGPLEQMKPWSMSGVEGVSRFIGRVWRMIVDDRSEDVQLHADVQDVPANENQLRVLHKTIKAVTEDIEKLSFNTAISRMMEFTNEISGQQPRPKSILEPFVLLLSPFAPHVAEELWQVLGHEETLAYESWPEFDETKIVESTIEIPVQVNGKVRARLNVPADADQAAIQAAAEADADVQKQLEGKQIVKVIVVPGRMVNFVVKG
ncbi:MAG: leucine--tRNA ligase [Planctomycetaceae bacterium]